MNNTFSCGICNLKFSVFDDFKGHMGQHVLTTKSQKISPPKRAFPTPPPSAKNVMKPVPTPALATPSSILIQKQQRYDVFLNVIRYFYSSHFLILVLNKRRNSKT